MTAPTPTPADPRRDQEAARRAASGTIRVGTRRLAVGLFWQMARPGSALKREATACARADKKGADLYCLKPGAHPQYALGSRADGHAPGLVSAAACAAEWQRGTFLACFRLEDGRWWHVAVIDDAVAALGDTVSSDEAEARRRFADDLASGRWEKVFAPAEWQIEGAQEATLASFLGGMTGPRLVRVDGGLVMARRAALLGGVALLAGAGALWWQQRQAAEAARLLEARRALERARIAEQQRVSIVPPWAASPPPGDVIARCDAGIGALPTTAPGWVLRKVSCDGASVKFEWLRLEGTLDWLALAVMHRAPAGTRFLPDGQGDRARIELPLSAPAATSRRDAPWEARDIKRHLWSQFQQIGERIEIKDPPPPLPGANPLAGAGVAKAALSFGFSTRLPPPVWSPVLGAVPALELSAIEWDGSTMRWQLSGKIYDKSGS